MCTVLIVASSSCGASEGRIILDYVYIFVGCNNRRVSLGMGQRHIGIGKVTDIVLLEWVHKDRHDGVDGFLEVGDARSFLDVSCGLYAGLLRTREIAEGKASLARLTILEIFQ